MFHAFPKRLTACLFAGLLVLSLVFVAAIQFGAGSHSASAHSAVAQVTIPHISWSHSHENGPTFSNTLTGRGFPQDDMDLDIAYSIDAELGGVCQHVTAGPINIGVDGTFFLSVEFENCKGNNNISASVSDDQHLNHAVFHIN